MQADWSVDCGADDPMVVVPWFGMSRDSVEGPIRYIDLREEPERIYEIPEAAQYPCMAAALLCWNQRDSRVFTAKCDVWNYPAGLFDADDLDGFPYAQGSYVDLLSRDLSIFSSFSACERKLRDWTERAQAIDLPHGRCEFTLRSARLFSTAAKSTSPSPAGSYTNGFATTLYAWGYGDSPQAAVNTWSQALMALMDPVFSLD